MPVIRAGSLAGFSRWPRVRSPEGRPQCTAATGLRAHNATFRVTAQRPSRTYGPHLTPARECLFGESRRPRATTPVAQLVEDGLEHVVGAGPGAIAAPSQRGAGPATRWRAGGG